MYGSVRILNVHDMESAVVKRAFGIACGLVMAITMENVSAGDVAAGKAKFESCVDCHGTSEENAAPNVPSLAGMDASFIRKALNTYKRCRPDDWLPPCGGSEEHIEPFGWEHRSSDSESMREVAAGLSDADIDNIAAYIATLRKP